MTGDSPPTYDALIIGSGPAGLATFRGLRDAGLEEILMLDKGRHLTARACPVDMGRHCGGCAGVCNVMSGFGGCMHVGDSIKLSRYPAGRRLFDRLGKTDYFRFEERALRFFEVDDEEFTVSASVPTEGGVIRAYPVAEVTEARLRNWLLKQRDAMGERSPLHSRVRTLQRIDSGGYRTSVALSKTDVRILESRTIVVATGRSGVGDLRRWTENLRITRKRGTASIGIRVELPRQYLAPLYQIHKDFKLSQFIGGAKVKTFCFSAHPEYGGRIKFCHYQDQFGRPLIFLDGHTAYEVSEESGNFALLLQESPDWGGNWFDKFCERYSAVSGGKPIWNYVNDRADRLVESGESRIPSRDMRRHDLHSIFPDGVLELLRVALEQVFQICERNGGAPTRELLDNAIVMAPAVEFLWDTANTSSVFDEAASGLYIVGDAAGIAQGNLQAAISGFAAAEAIAKRFANER